MPHNISDIEFEFITKELVDLAKRDPVEYYAELLIGQYGKLSSEDPFRNSTNTIQTLTFDGIQYVPDCGSHLTKQPDVNHMLLSQFIKEFEYDLNDITMYKFKMHADDTVLEYRTGCIKCQGRVFVMHITIIKCTVTELMPLDSLVITPDDYSHIARITHGYQEPATLN